MEYQRPYLGLIILIIIYNLYFALEVHKEFSYKNNRRKQKKNLLTVNTLINSGNQNLAIIYTMDMLSQSSEMSTRY